MEAKRVEGVPETLETGVTNRNQDNKISFETTGEASENDMGFRLSPEVMGNMESRQEILEQMMMFKRLFLFFSLIFVAWQLFNAFYSFIAVTTDHDIVKQDFIENDDEEGSDASSDLSAKTKDQHKVRVIYYLLAGLLSIILFFLYKVDLKSFMIYDKLMGMLVVLVIIGKTVELFIIGFIREAFPVYDIISTLLMGSNLSALVYIYYKRRKLAGDFHRTVVI